MKRISFWFLSTVSVVALLFGYHTSTSGPGATTAGSVFSSGPVAGGGTAQDTGSTSTAGSTGGASTRSGATSVSTVTGDVARTRWGPVQVQLRVDGSSITAVNVLQWPQGNSRDDQINSYALPILIDQTMQSQGTRVDMISGATVTSTGYAQSLQSALDQVSL